MPLRHCFLPSPPHRSVSPMAASWPLVRLPPHLPLHQPLVPHLVLPLPNLRVALHPLRLLPLLHRHNTIPPPAVRSPHAISRLTLTATRPRTRPWDWVRLLPRGRRVKSPHGKQLQLSVVASRVNSFRLLEVWAPLRAAQAALRAPLALPVLHPYHRRPWRPRLPHHAPRLASRPSLSTTLHLRPSLTTPRLPATHPSTLVATTRSCMADGRSRASRSITASSPSCALIFARSGPPRSRSLMHPSSLRLRRAILTFCDCHAISWTGTYSSGRLCHLRPLARPLAWRRSSSRPRVTRLAPSRLTPLRQSTPTPPRLAAPARRRVAPCPRRLRCRPTRRLPLPSTASPPSRSRLSARGRGRREGRGGRATVIRIRSIALAADRLPPVHRAVPRLPHASRRTARRLAVPRRRHQSRNPRLLITPRHWSLHPRRAIPIAAPPCRSRSPHPTSARCAWTAWSPTSSTAHVTRSLPT